MFFAALALAMSIESAELTLHHVATIGPDVGPARLAGPFGVATISGGGILVSDDLSHRVYHFDGKLNLIRVLGEAATTTDPELRKKLLLYKKHDDFLDKVKYLIVKYQLIKI